MTLSPYFTEQYSEMVKASSWVIKQPSWGPGVGHQDFTVVFMPGWVKQIAHLDP